MGDSYFDVIRKNMKPEDIERYQKVGKEFFSNFCFEQGLMYQTNRNSATVDSIVGAIKSGLTIQDLEDDDILLLKKEFGEEWNKSLKQIIEEDLPPLVEEGDETKKD